MKKINSRKELLKLIETDDMAYDVDAHYVMHDMHYEYPIWVDYQGCTHLGHSYKVRNKEQMLELKKIFSELE